MGGGVPRGGPPNQAAYYVALVGIVVLIVLLCCYFCYFCISKIRELSQEETPSTTPPASQQRATAYPVQPVIRDSATAMVALCKQVPGAGGAGTVRGGTVFPTSTSPAALHTDTGGGPALAPPHTTSDGGPLLVQEKLSALAAAPHAGDVEAR